MQQKRIITKIEQCEWGQRTLFSMLLIALHLMRATLKYKIPIAQTLQSVCIEYSLLVFLMEFVPAFPKKVLPLEKSPKCDYITDLQFQGIFLEILSGGAKNEKGPFFP